MELAGAVLLLLLSCCGLLALAAACILVSMLLVVRPWNGNINRAHKLPLSISYPVFWTAAWVYALAEWIAALKPAPMRIAELACTFQQSQVLFSIVSLGIPDSLASGPKTAAELAAAIGPTANAEWVDRLLSSAAVLGMLKRSKLSRSVAHHRAVAAAAATAATGHTANNSTASTAIAADAANSIRDQQKPSQPAAQHKSTAAAATAAVAGLTLQAGAGSDCVYVYSLNALSAALTHSSPVNMSPLVGLMQHLSKSFAHLSQGISTGTVPHQLLTGGQGFWDSLAQDPARATQFDLAMVTANHFAGTAVAHSYPWGQFDCVIDVAGGVGGLLLDVLQLPTPAPTKGVLFDLPSNIHRAKQIWSEGHPELLPRVELVAGDMFDAATLPSPPLGSRTAYVLRNILHDWPDADCIRILKAIRSSVDRAALADNGSNSSSGRVRLVVVETTTVEDVLPCHLPHRHGSDLVMLVSFGDAKERNREQFRSLFEASGWQLKGVTPTSSLFMVVEAQPV